MSNSDKTTPKTNGVFDPLVRLASFKAPRDLSLGGVKPNKKIFTPNLNVTRKKNKGSTSGQSRDPTKYDKGRKARRNVKNNTFVWNGPNVIQSTGVFSDGVGKVERNSARPALPRDSDPPPPALQRPILRVKDIVKIDRELEEQRIRAAVSKMVDARDEDAGDFRPRGANAPVRLPMEREGYNKKVIVKVKQEPVIKEEPDCEYEHLKLEPKVEVKREPLDDPDAMQMVRYNEQLLILLQFPMTLPGCGAEADDEPPRPRQPFAAIPSSAPIATSTSTPSAWERKEEEEPRCTLRDLEEGRIGKLRVHRSGRVTLLFGENVFEVCRGTTPMFWQELVSIGADEASRSAHMVSLGTMRNKLTCVPDWSPLLGENV